MENHIQYNEEYIFIDHHILQKKKNCMTAAGGQAMAMAAGNSVGDLARIERSSRYNS